MNKEKIVILGGGPTGLFSAWLLSEKGYNITIIEKTSKFGGICSSFKYKDMTFDYGPHKFYSTIPGIMNKMKNFLGNDCLTVKKKNSIRLKGKYFSFPPKIVEVILGLNPIIGLKCGFSFGISILKGFFTRKKNITYEDYFLSGFGREGYNLLFRDYAKKVWGDPKKLTEELARKRIPIPNIFELVKNMILGDKVGANISANQFYYPKQGFGRITDLLRQKIKKNGGKLISDSFPIELNENKGKKIITYRQGNSKKVIEANKVISTIPLRDLVDVMKSTEENIKKSVENLKYNGLFLVYLVLDKEKVLKDNWIFFPEKEFIFNRVSELKSFSPFIVPKNKTVIIAEITRNIKDQLWKFKDDKIKEIVVNDLRKAEIIDAGINVEDYLIKRAERVYPVYDLDFRKNLGKVLKFVHEKGILTIGRQGLFNYNNIDHCFDMGIKVSEHIINKGSEEDWKKVLHYFDNYKIVD